MFEAKNVNTFRVTRCCSDAEWNLKKILYYEDKMTDRRKTSKIYMMVALKTLILPKMLIVFVHLKLDF